MPLQHFSDNNPDIRNGIPLQRKCGIQTAGKAQRKKRDGARGAVTPRQRPSGAPFVTARALIHCSRSIWIGAASTFHSSLPGVAARAKQSYSSSGAKRPSHVIQHHKPPGEKKKTTFPQHQQMSGSIKLQVSGCRPRFELHPGTAGLLQWG